MRNKTVTLSILAVTIFLFSAWFIAQNTLLPSGEPIKSELNNMIRYAQQEKWDKAENSVNEILALWGKDKYLLAINYAEADYSLFIDNLSRIQGAVKTRDKTEAVSLALSAQKLWDNFIKVIPLP